MFLQIFVKLIKEKNTESYYKSSDKAKLINIFESQMPIPILKTDANSVVLVPLLLTLNIFHTLFYVSIVNFEHVNVDLITLT